ncbi:hypothetical protein L2129_08250 [Corynebacterium diphtheriae bv. mitis]|nr:hypothetical protein [Corynebacterium diphtheriae]MCM0017774.1 hypothetical protein [Corynebacterium diphtheriae bv. mitis]MCM0027480.1 hypothetical protein [Corynebacterium diphtheriae bv. mitis]MCM0038390.1 hypothetical protein [Corynebacterium diphtheriae bv. mitis]MCM0040552.1 hypothetical protein [Corynebacterium diphtheriae bv. mitis]MCM0047386.1 hypothetical protein [Corynebacterium diphtheriae bv. mitis]
MERVYDLGSVENDFASGGGIALEAVHVDDGDLIMELRCDYSAMFANALALLSKRVSASFWDNVKKPGGADDVSVASCVSVVRPVMLINTDDRDPR